MNNEKKTNEKTRKIIAISILVFGLIVAFVIYGIKPKKKVNNEAKIITYLREKYPESDFKIEQLVKKDQATTDGVNCDGYIIPPRNIKGKYIYYYDVLSTKDDIKFNVMYTDDNGEASFKDSYRVCKNNDKLVAQIIRNIKENLGHENLNEKSSFEMAENLIYNSSIDIYIDENLDDVLNEEYINRLYNIKNSINEIIDSSNTSYVNYDVNLHYKNDIHIELHSRMAPHKYLFIFGTGAGKWNGHTIDYYWRQQNE